MVFRGEISGKIYTGPFTHHVLIGADSDEFDINLLQMRYRPPAYTAGSPIKAANNAIDIFNPVYGQLPTPNTTLTNSLEVQKAYGVYFQDQIDLGERLKVRFGGRFDHFEQNITNRSGASPTPATRKRFSPTAGLLYKLTDTVSLYGGYGTGFRPNSGTSAPPPGQSIGSPFEPELSKSYEAGIRFNSRGNAITASLAAFAMKKNNVLTADPVNAGFSITGGTARSKGIEADLTARLPHDVQILATYAYTDAHWSSSSLDPNFGALIRPGDPLINIPKHSGNLLVTKGIDLGSSGKLTFGGGVNYISRRLGETATTFFLPGYTLARAFASYEPTDHLRIGIDVTNLFNATYYASSYSRFWIQLGAPRAITGRITYKF